MIRDAVAVAPHMYKIITENDRVRVLDVRSVPGVTAEMHSHPAQVAIAIADSQFTFTTPDGQTMKAALKAGQAMYLPPIEHATEITGTAESHMILVELK